MQMVKTVSMAFHPCHKPGRMSVEVYGSRTMVIGPTFRERWQRRVECPEGGLEVAAVLLLTHHQIQHSVGQGERGGSPPPTPPGEAQTYQVSFLKRLLRLQCPIEGCLGGASNQTNLRVHFSYRHARDIIVILEEGN